MVTPPLPPPGYELVEDEPRHKDLVWFLEGWRRVGKELVVLFGTGDNPIAADARDLRWIARKIEVEDVPYTPRHAEVCIVREVTLVSNRKLLVAQLPKGFAFHGEYVKVELCRTSD